MKTRLFTIAPALLLAASLSAHAQSSTWVADPNHSQADFVIRHMGLSNVRGTISKISGTVVWDEKDASKDSVVADLDTTTINTTVEARDKHLKSEEFFNVAKYPTIHFQSTSVKRVNGKLQVTGDLTLAGVTKPVVLDVDGPVPPQPDKRGLVSGFSATTVINRSYFNFGPKYVPPALGDEVHITLDLEIVKKQ